MRKLSCKEPKSGREQSVPAHGGSKSERHGRAARSFHVLPDGLAGVEGVRGT